MRRERVDVSGMIRALEDYLAATRPPAPPAPPRGKTETESKLEKLLEDLSKPLPPAAEPPAAQGPMELEDATSSTDSSRDEAVDNPLGSDELAPILMDDIAQENVVDDPDPSKAEELSTDLVRAESVDNSFDPPAKIEESRPPAADQARPNWTMRILLLCAAIGLTISPTILNRGPGQIHETPAVSSARPAKITQSARDSAPLPSDPQARALALVLAYRPSGGPVTTGEIFRSIAGDPIPGGNWEIHPQSEDRFLIRFVPYRGALGENYSYEFNVDARAGWARPRPDTVERLRADAIGRLAARPDLQAFWRFLDLGR